MPERLSLVTLGVADVAAATTFYEALGWRRSSASVEGEVSFFQLGPLVFSLYAMQHLAADAGVPVGEAVQFRGSSLAINLPGEAEVDAAFAAFVEAGGTVRAAPARAPWGGYTSLIADLDGHLWELAHNPGFALQPDGAIQLPG